VLQLCRAIAESSTSPRPRSLGSTRTSGSKPTREPLSDFRTRCHPPHCLSRHAALVAPCSYDCLNTTLSHPLWCQHEQAPVSSIPLSLLASRYRSRRDATRSIDRSRCASSPHVTCTQTTNRPFIPLSRCHPWQPSPRLALYTSARPRDRRTTARERLHHRQPGSDEALHTPPAATDVGDANSSADPAGRRERSCR
jgi:hypothetical protein